MASYLPIQEIQTLVSIRPGKRNIKRFTRKLISIDYDKSNNGRNMN